MVTGLFLWDLGVSHRERRLWEAKQKTDTEKVLKQMQDLRDDCLFHLTKLTVLK